MRSGEDYDSKWAYVRQNPERHGLVEYADSWPFQGANFRVVFGNLTGEDARPTLWRGRPRPRLEFGHFPMTAERSNRIAQVL
jgi:hypothetical protein